MKNKLLKIGIIGCGHVAQYHLEAYSKNPNAEIIAVADTDVNKVEKTSERFDCKGYVDYERLLQEEECDGVSICLPTFRHKSAVITALDKGLHVLCEKPLALSTSEAEEIIPHLSDQILMVGFCTRFHAPLQQAKEWISSGKIGEVLMFRSRLADYLEIKKTWMADRSLGGGWYMEASQHGIDQFRWLVGEVKSVTTMSKILKHDVNVEDSGIIILEGVSGALGVVEGSFATPLSENRVEIYASEGSILVDFNDGFAQCRMKDKQSLKEFCTRLRPFHRFDLEIEHFIECILTKQQPLISFKDGIKALEVMETARCSLETGETIQLS